MLIVVGILAPIACGSNDRRTPSSGPVMGFDPLFGPSSADVTFSGRVVDFVTQMPVAGASVDFRREILTPGVTTMTDSNGQYTLTAPATGEYSVYVDAQYEGRARVNGRGFRGDVLVSAGTCISRYGLVIDSETLRPVSGATATLKGVTVTTGSDGWYRIDLGCPAVIDIFAGGSTFIALSHPAYKNRTLGVGRGVYSVSRLDVALDH